MTNNSIPYRFIAGIFIFLLLVEPVLVAQVTGQDLVTLFLAGDVMTGRGIDQILPHPGDPQIHESYMKSAVGYVEIAEQMNGPIPAPVPCAYIWGDALGELQRMKPDLRIINLETSITTSDDYWPGKGINYRMHPHNIACIAAAGFDACSLANNHVLDWGYAGLSETLATLRRAQIKQAGAGPDLHAAGAPVVMEVPGKGRVLMLAFGFESSGIPARWAARENRPGVFLLDDLDNADVRTIRRKITAVKQPGDIIVASIHWGSNWGYRIPRDQVRFAHKLIDEAGVDVIHGHSSHHPRPLEVYQDKLIIYGAGDFLNDYEGIAGYESFRSDLTLMYFAGIDPATGKLVQLVMTPMQIKKFRLNRVSATDAAWLLDTLNREGKKFGTRVQLNEENALVLQ